MKRQAYTYYEQTVLDNITLDAYEIESVDNYTDIQEVYKIFVDEYGYNIPKMGELRAFKEWLQGLPTVLTVPFYNFNILNNGKQAGYDLSTEDKEDAFLATYFDKVASAFFTLKNNL